MLRLPTFDVVAPVDVAGVVAALQTPGARILAGGTDLLPNLKHRLEAPALLVSLSKVRELGTVTRTAEHVRIGAGVTLTELSRHPEVTVLFPSLARAAGLVASPLLRNMGTIGGNVNLDTRCRYVNQTAFWRKALGGGCLKSEGTVCHVVPKGQSCVAAMSSDCAPVLITLDAVATLIGPEGSRTLPMADYYKTDGIRHVNRSPGELLTEVMLPLPTTPRRTGYAKWTIRKSIDFPLISVALRFDLESDSVDSPIASARVCMGVLAARPKELKQLERLRGLRLGSPHASDLLCDLIEKQGKPLDNVPYDAAYRRKILPVIVRRELAALR